MRLGAAALMLFLAAASPDPRYFRYERPVQNAPQRGGQTCVVLDPGIFAHSASNLSDLRLYRGSAESPYSNESPYVVRLASPQQGAAKSIAPLNLGTRGGQTVFDAPMPAGEHSDIALEVTAHDFIATVTVSGSASPAGAAEIKLGNYTIFDLTRQKLGRSTVLHLPQSDFPYLHFQIDGPLSPENVTGLSAERLPDAEPKYEIVGQSSTVAQKGHSSIYKIIVPPHVPVDRVAFNPGSEPAMFSRDLTITVTPISRPPTDIDEAPQQATSWGSILRIHSTQDGHKLDEERLAVDAPAGDFDTQAAWEITIENGDDAPVRMDSVRLEMLQRRLCFEAGGAAAYTLFYGDAALSAPSYDYAKLSTPEADATVATLGPEEANPTFQDRPDERPFTEKHPALLWAALVAVIALLGLIAVRSAGRSNPPA